MRCNVKVYSAYIGQIPMNTLFADSPDSVRIAFDRSGTGPALVLIHGGGSNRQEWHEAGYVGRLREHFTVITLDLRGHGESGLPTEPADYTIDKMMQDVLAVADACEVECFTVWGFSFGGRVGRYMANQSERVAKIILMGTPLGLGISREFRAVHGRFLRALAPNHTGPMRRRTGSRLALPTRSGVFAFLQCSSDDGLGACHARLARHRTSRFSLSYAMARRFRRPRCYGQRQGIRAIAERLQSTASYSLKV